MPKPPSIFISYAHRDSGDLALRLKRDLDSLGFDVWLDKHRLKGGDRWTNEIEEALDHAQVVLALLSDGSFESDPCRAEQGWALDAGKRVIPVKVQCNCRVPLPLYPLQQIDFSDPTRYTASFQQIQASLGDHHQTVPAQQPRYNNAPSLPDNFVARPELLANLRDKLFEESLQRNIALTALQGMGGIGKTVLAQALCRDTAVAHRRAQGRRPFAGQGAGEAAEDGRKERAAKAARGWIVAYERAGASPKSGGPPVGRRAGSIGLPRGLPVPCCPGSAGARSRGRIRKGPAVTASRVCYWPV
jgi:TIR domain